METSFISRSTSTVACLGLVLLLCPLPAQDHAWPTNPPTTKDILAAPAQRRFAPDFTLTDDDGHTFSLLKARGNVVVLNFWATWCGGCKFELPYFVAYDRQYRSQGMVTLGI